METRRVTDVWVEDGGVVEFRATACQHSALCGTREQAVDVARAARGVDVFLIGQDCRPKLAGGGDVLPDYPASD